METLRKVSKGKLFVGKLLLTVFLMAFAMCCFASAPADAAKRDDIVI